MIEIPKPRIFVSSTYYDLKYIRNDLEMFIESYGFEPILFERGHITYDHEKSIDASCNKEVSSSQMLILIIGGRYGTSTSGTRKDEEDSFFELYNSITKDEYVTAAREGIPIYIFIEKQVHNEYYTFLKNRNNPNVRYAHVDNINVFKFIEDVHNQFSNNVICDFERFEDIRNWLKNQWAGLFYEYLSGKKSQSDIKSLSEKISDLGDVTETLKNYLEKILKVSNSKDAEKIIHNEEERLRLVKDSRTKARILDSSMMQYMYQHTDLDKEQIFEVFCSTESLREFLQKLNIKKKEMDYILSEPMAESNYQEYRKLLNSG